MQFNENEYFDFIFEVSKIESALGPFSLLNNLRLIVLNIYIYNNIWLFFVVNNIWLGWCQKKKNEIWY